MFLRNCWYVAAWDHELDDGFLSRTILDEPVVLFRSADGLPRALENRCCHRSMPLSQGGCSTRRSSAAITVSNSPSTGVA